MRVTFLSCPKIQHNVLRQGSNQDRSVASCTRKKTLIEQWYLFTCIDSKFEPSGMNLQKIMKHISLCSAVCTLSACEQEHLWLNRERRRTSPRVKRSDHARRSKSDAEARACAPQTSACSTSSYRRLLDDFQNGGSRHEFRLAIYLQGLPCLRHLRPQYVRLSELSSAAETTG